MNDILTVFQACKHCNVSPKTIINWVEAGHIKAYKTVGGHRRIKKLDLEDFMRKQGIPLPAEESASERKRILIVNDDPNTVETIAHALQGEQFNYEISSASDSFEAGFQVPRFRPHLLILDSTMPDIKGDDVCKMIKTNAGTRDIRIIVLSAYQDDKKFEKMRECGADLCFSKPLPLPHLKAEVARLLDLV